MGAGGRTLAAKARAPAVQNTRLGRLILALMRRPGVGTILAEISRIGKTSRVRSPIGRTPAASRKAFQPNERGSRLPEGRSPIRWSRRKYNRCTDAAPFIASDSAIGRVPD